MAESYFLTKTVIDPARMLDLGGRPALEQHAALQAFVQARAGRDAADVFAEPVMSRGNGAAETTVSWYVARSGEGRPVADLAPDSRAAVEAQLSRLLTALSSGLSDPDFGPLLGAALHVDGERSVWAVDGKPFLVGWGMCPAEAQTSPEARGRHFAETMGRLLPIAASPAITREEWQARGYGASAPATPGTSPADDGGAGAAAGDVQAAPMSAAIPGGDTAAQAAAAGPGGTPPPVPPGGGDGGPPFAGAQGGEPGGEQGPWRWRWIAPVALLVLFAAALGWILWPGNLLYPLQTGPSVIQDEAVAEAAREANRTLEQRVRDLRAAVDGAVCLPDGRLALPDGRTPDGRRAELPRSEPAQPGQPAIPGAETPTDAATGPRAPREDGLIEVEPDALTPQSPNQIVTPPATEGGDPVTLLQTIEARTVLVLALGSDSGGHGTGWAVGPDLVLTNHHVVQPAGAGGQIVVTSEHLGRLLEGQLIAQSGPLMQTGDDFALIRVPGLGADPYPLVGPGQEIKLQQVIAAGYPGYVLESDADFDVRALLQGDMSRIPDMVLTQGVVNTQQRFGADTNVVIHTASISAGNSGGPLVDSCGRVVGINTFGRGKIREQQGNPELRIAITLNFAIANGDVLEFLRANGVGPTVLDEPCRPLVRADRPAPPAEAPDAQAEAPADAETPAGDGRQ